MSGYVLGERSLKNLVGVHPKLGKVVRSAPRPARRSFTPRAAASPATR